MMGSTSVARRVILWKQTRKHSVTQGKHTSNTSSLTSMESGNTVSIWIGRHKT